MSHSPHDFGPVFSLVTELYQKLSVIGAGGFVVYYNGPTTLRPITYSLVDLNSFQFSSLAGRRDCVKCVTISLDSSGNKWQYIYKSTNNPEQTLHPVLHNASSNAASLCVLLCNLVQRVSEAMFSPALQNPFIHFFEINLVVRPVSSSQSSGENMQGH